MRVTICLNEVLWVSRLHKLQPVRMLGPEFSQQENESDWVCFAQVKGQDFTAASVTKNAVVCGANFRSRRTTYSHSGAMVTTVAYSKKVLGVHVLHICVDSLQVLWLPPKTCKLGELLTQTFLLFFFLSFLKASSS